MNKLIIITTIISILFFGLMKYETTQPWDGIKLVIVVLASLMFISWMIAALLVAQEITEREDTQDAC